MSLDTAGIRKILKAAYRNDERSGKELKQLFRLMGLFTELPPPPDPIGIHAGYPELKEKFISSLTLHNPEDIETSFLELYCCAHGYEATYTKEERELVNKTGGYWCHSGGISPLLKAADWINPGTVSADYGAGNGLQGLLLQHLYPHKKTVQIEISSKMVQSGKELRKWLGIPSRNIEWIVDDVRNQSPIGYNFVYLYRPLKPEGTGIEFYEKFASALSRSDNSPIIFSIADCLKDYLADSFETFYCDGHLTCFRKKPDQSS